MKNIVIVTRHKALVEFLINSGKINATDSVIEHAKEADIKGKHVIGVLPLSLAAKALSVTEATLNIPFELRGKELTLEDVEKCFCGFKKYTVQEVPEPNYEQWDMLEEGYL